MKLQMAKDSLFAILVRSSWWISFLIAAAVAAGALLLLPAQYAIVGAFSCLPFVVTGSIAAWRQLHLTRSHQADCWRWNAAMDSHRR